MVSDETIAATLKEYSDPNQCAERLVQLALRGGGPDNITVIIADVTDVGIREEEPVVGGAAATDRGMGTSADTSTPAARASALSGPRDASPADGTSDDDERPRRHPVRTSVILVVLAALLGGGLWLGWRYTQSRYYVGVTDDGTVAVFQGIPGEIAGFDLSTVDTLSGIKIDELTPVAQDKVKEGIPSENKEDARQKLQELLNPSSRNLKDPCPTPAPTPLADHRRDAVAERDRDHSAEPVANAARPNLDTRGHAHRPRPTAGRPSVSRHVTNLHETKPQPY